MLCQAEMRQRMNKIWNKWSWLFHVVSVVFLAGVAWAGVEAQSVRIDKLERKSEVATSDIYSIKQDTAIIKESLRWIEQTLGRRK